MVENVDESIAFYQDVLGFSVVDSVPSEKGGLQFAIMQKEGFQIMLQEKSSMISEYPNMDTPKVQPSVTIYIEVDDFDSVYHDIKGKHKILCDIHETFYGAKEFAIVDNSGYVLTFAKHQAQ